LEETDAMSMTVLALAILAVAPDEPDTALQGTWVVAKAQREGKEAPDVVGHQLVIDGDKFEILEREKLLFRGTVTVDKSRGPLWRIDIKHAYGNAAGTKWLGVMRIRDKGVMDICDNAVDPAKPRPDALESVPGSGTILLEFRRMLK
jgi:uncharacterized protein (TIGR03067 family)